MIKKLPFLFSRIHHKKAPLVDFKKSIILSIYIFHFYTLYQISLFSHSEKGKGVYPKVLDFKNSLRENS